jgi:hypothetical protein
LRIICLFAAAGLLGPLAALTQIGSPPTVGQIMPSDIDPQSGFACRCRNARIWMTPAKRTTTAWRHRAPRSPGCKARAGSGSTARRPPSTRARSTVIELGRQIFRDHKVTAEMFAKAKALFGPNKLVELVMLMGNYAGTAALLTAVDMQLHPGQKPLLPIP